MSYLEMSLLSMVIFFMSLTSSQYIKRNIKIALTFSFMMGFVFAILSIVVYITRFYKIEKQPPTEQILMTKILNDSLDIGWGL